MVDCVRTMRSSRPSAAQGVERSLDIANLHAVHACGICRILTRRSLRLDVGLGIQVDGAVYGRDASLIVAVVQVRLLIGVIVYELTGGAATGTR